MRQITHSGHFFDQLSYHVWKPCAYLHQVCSGKPLQVYKWEGNGQFSPVVQNKKIENLALRIIKFVAALMIALPAFLTFHVFKFIARRDDGLGEKYRQLDHFLIEKQNNNQKKSVSTTENVISQLPTELKLNIFGFLDIPDLARLRGVNREFQQLMKNDHAFFVEAYQKNIKGLEPSEKNSSFYALIEKVKNYTAHHYIRHQSIYFFGSLKRMMEYPTFTPEQKNLYSWLEAQSLEDWERKPDILRVQGQHFEIGRFTETIVMKYSIFLPKELFQSAQAVDRVGRGYLFTQTTIDNTSPSLCSDMIIQTPDYWNLLREEFNDTDYSFNLKKPFFCSYLPRLCLSNRGDKDHVEETLKVRKRFQEFIEGKQISFYENLSDTSRKKYPYLDKVVFVLGWKALEDFNMN